MARTTKRAARRWIALAAIWWVAAPAFAGHDDLQRYLTAAARLYHNLDNERALEQVQRAKQYASGLEDDVVIALYEGTILADLGRLDDAQAAFRTGLLLDPTAKLPLKVSPKVERQVETLRASVEKELAVANAKREESERKAREAREREEAQERAEAAKRAAAQQPVVQLEMPAAPVTTVPHPIQAPAAALSGGELVAHGGKRGPKVLPWALGGAAVVAAGVGGFFGLTSQQQYQQARSATFQDDRLRLQGQASQSATTANVLFGVGGLAAIGAAVTFVLPN